MSFQDRSLLDRITTDPSVLGGKPIVRGTRVSVGVVLDHLAEAMNVDVLGEIFPHVTTQDVQACLKYAAGVFAGEIAAPRPAREAAIRATS